jgi:hypothetical protein
MVDSMLFEDSASTAEVMSIIIKLETKKIYYFELKAKSGKLWR